MVCASFILHSQCSSTYTSTQVTCFNACNGTITVNPITGIPPFTYLWVPGGQTTQVVTGLCAGNYIVNCIAANGCYSTLNITITQPAQITTTVTTIPASCNICCDGSASAVTSGGFPPYVYNWFPSGNPLATEIGLCPGTYSFSVTDANGCVVGSPLINIGNSVGVQEQSEIINFSIFPNPAFEFIVLETPFQSAMGASIIISNVLGQIIYVNTLQSIVNNNNKIDISTYQNGIYFVQILTKTGSAVKQFLKN